MFWMTGWECEPGPRLNTKTVFPGIGIPTLKIWRSWAHLSFNMGIPILVRQHLYIETAPDAGPVLIFISPVDSTLWHVKWNNIGYCYTKPNSTDWRIIPSRSAELTSVTLKPDRRRNFWNYSGMYSLLLLCVFSHWYHDYEFNIDIFIVLFNKLKQYLRRRIVN